jgi:hypothetical protein
MNKENRKLGKGKGTGGGTGPVSCQSATKASPGCERATIFRGTVLADGANDPSPSSRRFRLHYISARPAFAKASAVAFGFGATRRCGKRADTPSDAGVFPGYSRIFPVIPTLFFNLEENFKPKNF